MKVRFARPAQADLERIFILNRQFKLRSSPRTRGPRLCRKNWVPASAGTNGGCFRAQQFRYKPSMIPWSLIDTAQVPGGGELRLKQRGAEFSMMLGQNELMNSRLSGSEEALATLACRRIDGVKRPHLLIGGLGMGFTLRAALAVLDAQARITVAELVPAVIVWARGPMADIFGNSLN